MLPWHIPPWSNGRLKHQIEGDGRCEVISCGGGLDVVFLKEIRQLLLGVVVHLKIILKRKNKCSESFKTPKQLKGAFYLILLKLT